MRHGCWCIPCSQDRRNLFLSGLQGPKIYRYPITVTIKRTVFGTDQLSETKTMEYLSWELVAGSFCAYLSKFPYLSAEWRFTYDHHRSMWQLEVECTTEDKNLFGAFCFNRTPAEPPRRLWTLLYKSGMKPKECDILINVQV